MCLDGCLRWRRSGIVLAWIWAKYRIRLAGCTAPYLLCQLAGEQVSKLQLKLP